MADTYFWTVVFLAFFGTAFSATALYYSHQLYDEKIDDKEDLTIVDAMLGTMIGVFGLLAAFFMFRFFTFSQEAVRARETLSNIPSSLGGLKN